MNTGLAEYSSIVEVGQPMIDAQHKQIFELAATFTRNGDEVRVMQAIAVLCDHVKSHFRDEEEMMASCAYPGLATHRQLHDECRAVLVRLLDNAIHMSLDQIADEVKHLVDGWIYNHILTADFAYVPYVKHANLYGVRGNPKRSVD